MPAYFCDASALVKRYSLEPGTRFIRELSRQPGRIFISPLSGPDVTSGLFQKGRMGEIAPDTRRWALRRFRSDFRTAYVLCTVTRQTAELAMDLLRRHPLRGADALQLSSALQLLSRRSFLRPLVFVCADIRDRRGRCITSIITGRCPLILPLADEGTAIAPALPRT